MQTRSHHWKFTGMDKFVQMVQMVLDKVSFHMLQWHIEDETVSESCDSGYLVGSD